MSADPRLASLIEAASARYRAAGHFAWRFARGKLGGDPMFAGILAHGLLAERARILDLGCGQGLLASWLLAAHDWHASARDWPAGWPPPPRFESYRGIEINPHEAVRAQRAFAAESRARLQIVRADISNVDYGSTDAVVILDVLHFIDYATQEQVLTRVRAALEPGGLLLLRIGDASAGLGFSLGVAWDHTVALVRRGRWRALQCRPLREWQALLGQLGFRSAALPMSAGTAFANVLLVAHPA